MNPKFAFFQQEISEVVSYYIWGKNSTFSLAVEKKKKKGEKYVQRIKNKNASEFHIFSTKLGQKRLSGDISSETVSDIGKPGT